MKKIFPFLMAISFLVACSDGNQGASQGSSSAMGAARILEPTNGETVSANAAFTVSYEVTRSANGDHLHITVDGGKPDIVKQLKGAYQVSGLSPGEHTITIMEMTSGHSPTGNQASVTVTAQ